MHQMRNDIVMILRFSISLLNSSILTIYELKKSIILLLPQIILRHPLDQILPTLQSTAAACRLSSSPLFCKPQAGTIKTVDWQQITSLRCWLDICHYIIKNKRFTSGCAEVSKNHMMNIICKSFNICKIKLFFFDAHGLQGKIF